MKKILKQYLLNTCRYFVENVGKKPKFFNDITNILNTSVEVNGIIEVNEKLIKDICNYCEEQAIYDKLTRYGDFYYKLVRYYWI